MRRYLIAATTIVSSALLFVSPAIGQTYGSAAGWGGGVLINTGLNKGAASGDLVELKPDLTWLVSAHYDRWFGTGNVGVRARAGLSKPVLPWVQGDRAIRLLMADVGLLLRPVAPSAGKTVLPFLAGGIGLVSWGLGSGPMTTFDGAGATYSGDESLDLAVSAGLGFDIITPWRWGEGPLVVRIEGRDMIQLKSPFDPMNPDDSDFDMIHNAAVVLGFHTGIGILGGR